MSSQTHQAADGTMVLGQHQQVIQELRDSGKPGRFQPNATNGMGEGNEGKKTKGVPPVTSITITPYINDGKGSPPVPSTFIVAEGEPPVLGIAVENAPENHDKARDGRPSTASAQGTTAAAETKTEIPLLILGRGKKAEIPKSRDSTKDPFVKRLGAEETEQNSEGPVEDPSGAAGPSATPRTVTESVATERSAEKTAPAKTKKGHWWMLGRGGKREASDTTAAVPQADGTSTHPAAENHDETAQLDAAAMPPVVAMEMVAEGPSSKEGANNNKTIIPLSKMSNTNYSPLLKPRWLKLTFPQGYERVANEYCTEINRKPYRGLFAHHGQPSYQPDLPSPEEAALTVLVPIHGHVEMLTLEESTTALRFRNMSSAKRFQRFALLFEHPTVEPQNQRLRMLIMPAKPEDEYRERLACTGSRVLPPSFFRFIFDIIFDRA